MVKRGEADSLICGTFGQYLWHLKYIEEILAGDGLKPVGALSMMILEWLKRNSGSGAALAVGTGTQQPQPQQGHV